MFMIVSLFGRLGDVCVTKTDAAACELSVVVVVKAFSWRGERSMLVENVTEWRQ